MFTWGDHLQAASESGSLNWVKLRIHVDLSGEAPSLPRSAVILFGCLLSGGRGSAGAVSPGLRLGQSLALPTLGDPSTCDREWAIRMSTDVQTDWAELEREGDRCYEEGLVASDPSEANWPGSTRAIAAQQAALELKPDEPHTFHNLGCSLENRGLATSEDEKSGWFDRAIEAYRKSLEAFPDNPVTLFALGGCLLNRGVFCKLNGQLATTPHEACQWFEQAAEIT